MLRKAAGKLKIETATAALKISVTLFEVFSETELFVSVRGTGTVLPTHPLFIRLNCLQATYDAIEFVDNFVGYWGLG